MIKICLRTFISIAFLACLVVLISGKSSAGNSVINDFDTSFPFSPSIACNETKDTIVLVSTESFKNQIDSRLNGREKTLYIIGADFDLKSETIIIPSQSVLKFTKGKLYNGTIEGKETQVISARDSIFNNVIIKGSWKASNPRAEWFGANGNDNFDDTYAFKALAKFSGRAMFEKAKTYLVNDYVFIKSNIEWDLNESTIKLFENKSFSMYISQAENVIIRNGNIIGNRIADASNLEYGITIDASKNIVLENLYFSQFSRDGIYVGYEWSDSDEELHATESIIINKCVFDNVARNGITIGAGENIEVSNCVFKNINTTFPKSGIDIEPENISKSKYLNLNNIRIHNCEFENCRLAISVYQSNYNYQSGDVYISDIDCINSILYIENIKKDGGFNTYINKVIFKDCKDACIQITNPCNRMHTNLLNVQVKSTYLLKSRKQAAVAINANGDRSDIGGVLIDGFNLGDSTYEYIVYVSHSKDKQPGRLTNLSLKNIKRKWRPLNNDIILAEETVLDKNTLEANKSLKRKIQYIRK